MTDQVLTPERILDAAEDVLRRFGPSKTTVVDVARALDVSHGSIYRHFQSKAALREAVANRWLHRLSTPLEPIVDGTDPAPDRLLQWFQALRAMKREKVLGDPELFTVYHQLAEEAGEAVAAHVAELVTQVTRIVGAGVAEGSIYAPDPQVTARSLLIATTRFHHPAHAGLWKDPEIDAQFDAVWALLMQGLLVR